MKHSSTFQWGPAFWLVLVSLLGLLGLLAVSSCSSSDDVADDDDGESSDDESSDDEQAAWCCYCVPELVHEGEFDCHSRCVERPVLGCESANPVESTCVGSEFEAPDAGGEPACPSGEPAVIESGFFGCPGACVQASAASRRTTWRCPGGVEW